MTDCSAVRNKENRDMATSGSTTEVLERVKVREVVGVFRSRDVLDAAVHALLSSGFDRADIDVLVGAEAHQGLGGVKLPVEELPDVPDAPRRPFIDREDLIHVWSLVLAILIFAGAAAAPWLVVSSGRRSPARSHEAISESCKLN